MKLTCDICGHIGIDVRPGVVAWRDPAQPYAAVDRCVNIADCADRVAAKGEEWPVFDRKLA
jgi:hypothetical protein